MKTHGQELLLYFEPISQSLIDCFSGDKKACLFAINKHTEDNKDISPFDSDIAILGVPEDRNTQNIGCAQAPDKIRSELYSLFKPRNRLNIVDLGNFRIGKKINDTYIGLRDVLFELIKNDVLPIIIGGSQDITYANFLAYERLENWVNIVSVDSRFDLGDAEQDFNSRSYLSKIVLEKSKNLFNYTNLGFQNYLNNPEETELMNNLFFDVFRLGRIRTEIAETEPMIREGDLFTFDISSIKHADAPGNYAPSPNGIFAHEACQMARYAGMSDKLTSFGIYETNPVFDINNQTSHLAAQIIWHCIEGFYSRKKDYPYTDIEQYTKFIVNLSNGEYEIVFYKSPKSGRWWMEIPYPDSKIERKLIVACSHQDYLNASQDDIPDRWWKFYQKLS